MKQHEKPKYSLWQSICFMLDYAWRVQKKAIFLCLGFALLGLVINLVQLFLAPSILLKVEQAAPLPSLAGTIGIFTLVLIFLFGLREYTSKNQMFVQIQVRTTILNDLNEKALTTSYPNVNDPKLHELQKRACESGFSNSAPLEHIWTTLSDLLLNLSGFGVYLAMLSGLDPVLLVVVVVTSVISFFANQHRLTWQYQHMGEVDKAFNQARYFQKTMESPATAKDIRIFGLVPWLQQLRQKAFDLFDDFIVRRDSRLLFTTALDLAMTFLRNGIAYYYLIRLLFSTGMPVSQFLLYFTAFSGFSQWVTGILTQLTELRRETLEISAVQEFLHLPEPFRFEGGTPIPAASEYELRLEGVSFRYPGTEKDILHEMDLTIHPGERLAVVGLNGAGKTTLVKLLCGLYDPDQGRVLLNGRDIRQFNRQEYYRLFSAVFQDFCMPDLTVAQTVAQDYENIDQARVQNVLEKVGLLETVAALPKGTDTHLGKQIFLDGVRLSGGQTQRMMLARALYKDGPILVLDEPTAALDPLAENDIYQKYSQLTKGKTSLFISHRLASTRFCDRILFLQDGAIAEEGTHDQLLAKGGDYARLFQVQARYYQEGRDFT